MSIHRDASEFLHVVKCFAHESNLWEAEHKGGNIHIEPPKYVEQDFGTCIKAIINVEQHLINFCKTYPKRNRNLLSMMYKVLDNPKFKEFKEGVSEHCATYVQDDHVSLPYLPNNFALPNNHYGPGILIVLPDTVNSSDRSDVLIRAMWHVHETNQDLYFVCYGIEAAALANFVSGYEKRILRIPPIVIGQSRFNKPQFGTLERIFGCKTLTPFSNDRISDVCGQVKRSEISDGRIKLFRE